jgi:hypothetical protein
VRVSAAAALLAIAIFSATVSPADLGPFGGHWEVTTETGGQQRLWPDEHSDAVIVHPESTLTYYASVPGRPAHVTFPVRPPATAEALELQINAHNSKRLQLSINGRHGAGVERDLPQGRLIWIDVPLPPALRDERRFDVDVTLEGADGQPTMLYGLRLRAPLQTSSGLWRTALKCASTLVLCAILFLVSARVFARAAALDWRNVVAADAAALWPLALLAAYPIVRGAVRRAGLLTLVIALLAYWIVRTLARIPVVDQSRTPDRAARAIISSCFVFATLVFGKPIVNGDGVQYYAYARTTVVDRNLYVAEEYRDGLGRFLSSGPLLGKTPRGYDYAFAPVGAAVFWLPPMCASHAIGAALRLAGIPANMDGYSDRYLFAVAATSWLMMFAGLLCCYQLLVRYFNPRTSLGAVLCGLFASPLFANAYELPMFVHAVDFALSSVFACVILGAAARQTEREWLAIGVIGGVLVAIRQQNAAFLALPAMLLVRMLLSERRPAWHVFRLTAIAGAGFALGFLPQIAMNLALFGRPVVFHPIYLPSARWPPALWRDLFSARQGLFFWTPLMLVAVTGLVCAAWQRRHRLWASMALLAVGVQVVLVGIIPYGPNLIGQRYLVNCTPYFILGLAAAFEFIALRLRSRSPGRTIVYPVVVGAILWNIGLDTLVVRGLIDRWGPVPPTELLSKLITVAPLHLGDHLLGLSINQPSFSVFVQLGYGLNGDGWALLRATVAAFVLVASAAWMTRRASRWWDGSPDPRFPRAALVLLILLTVSAAATWLYLGWDPGTHAP